MSKQQEVPADSQSSATATSYRVLRELAKRSQRSFIAVRESTRERNEQSVVGPPPSSGSPLSSAAGGSLVVLNRFVRTTSTQAGQRVSQEAIAILLRDARCLEKNWHPNIARVRHVDLIGDTLSIATELLDGVTLADLFTLAKEQRALQGPVAEDFGSQGLPPQRLPSRGNLILPPPVLARIFLDVLSGLAALHALRDGIDKPLSLFHGELCPANIVIGKDGVARVVNVFRPRPVTIAAASEALRYASPETLAGEVEQDARADIYAIGVMLWEALMGRPLYGDELPSRIAQRQREEDVPRPPGPLGDFAMRALSFDPALRFRTAQDAATHLRVASRSALATGSVVAQTVVDLAGDRIRSRRMELEPLLAGRTISGQRRAAQLGNAMQSGSHPIQPSGTPRSRPPMPPISFKEPASPAPPPIAQPRPAASSEPDVETSYAPRPLPARRPAAGSVPFRKSPPPLPVATPALPAPPESASALPASRKLPPPLPVSAQLDAHDEDDDDDDLPGPRGSTPDVNYLDELGVLAAAAAAAAVKEEIIDAGDLIDEESDALAAAREVVVSQKSITPVPPALPAEASGAPPPPFSSAPTVVGGPSPLFLHTPSSPMTPSPIPRSDAPTVQAPTPFPEFPPVDQLTSRLSGAPPPSFPKSTPTLHTSIERPAAHKPPAARPAPAPPASERGAPTTRTPFVVDVLPLRPSVSASKNALAALGDRRVVGIAIAIGTAAIVMLMVGAALIARRSGAADSTSNASSRHEEQQQLESHPPSTVVVPPPTAVDTLPAASSKSPQK